MTYKFLGLEAVELADGLGYNAVGNNYLIHREVR